MGSMLPKVTLSAPSGFPRPHWCGHKVSVEHRRISVVEKKTCPLICGLGAASSAWVAMTCPHWPSSPQGFRAGAWPGHTADTCSCFTVGLSRVGSLLSEDQQNQKKKTQHWIRSYFLNFIDTKTCFFLIRVSLALSHSGACWGLSLPPLVTHRHLAFAFLPPKLLLLL